jgi:hypothetical protein
MANADFWRDLTVQFCALSGDDEAFRFEWRVHAREERIRWKQFGKCDQFGALASRAGSALNPESDNFLWTWLSLLKDAIPESSTLSVKTKFLDETTLDLREGSIRHPQENTGPVIEQVVLEGVFQSELD